MRFVQANGYIFKAIDENTISVNAKIAAKLHGDVATTDALVNQANAYDELVKALKEACEVIGDLGSGKGGWAWEDVLDGYAATLAKAVAA